MTGLSRRNVLIGSLVTAAAVGAGVGNAAPALATPFDDQIADLERRHNALIGLYASNLDSGRTLTHRPDEMFAMCSTFKGYAAARVLQMVGRRQISLDNRVFVDREAIVPNSPITETHVGAEMTLAELCQAALQRSDNTAGNLLLKTIDGPAGITAFARSIGAAICDRQVLDLENRVWCGIGSALGGDWKRRGHRVFSWLDPKVP
ncbi:serine hydrolase, partial [Mycolicibacterium porcinum]|uniref:serine hydrolase n=1 Tax=Mycolicibacterium porcinum TaxID=39693 RepID=UPI0013F4D744